LARFWTKQRITVLSLTSSFTCICGNAAPYWQENAYAAQYYAFGLLRTTSIALSAADKKPELAKRPRRSHDLRWQNSADVRSIKVADVKH
jgi:hypothetical protein